MHNGRSDLNEELLSLIDLAYACAADSERWPAFLARLTGAMNSRGATLVLQDRKRGQSDFMRLVLGWAGRLHLPALRDPLASSEG